MLEPGLRRVVYRFRGGRAHKTWLDKLICDVGATGLTTGNLQPGYTGD